MLYYRPDDFKSVAPADFFSLFVTSRMIADGNVNRPVPSFQYLAHQLVIVIKIVGFNVN